ncbi:hypothetical protein LCM17_12995 [Cereibacter sphaeroides]|nr:hypothetical protein [Cereibacter sphaeroides]
MAEGENPEEVDLWGNRVYSTKRKQGRPPFQRTEENARKVSMMLAVGYTNERIANLIRDPRTGKSISVPTLKRHFRAELETRQVARDMMTIRRLERLWVAAEGGNVGADKQFGLLMEDELRGVAADRARRGKNPSQPEPEAKPEKPLSRGKKEEAAQRASDMFAGSALLSPQRH